MNKNHTDSTETQVSPEVERLFRTRESFNKAAEVLNETIEVLRGDQRQRAQNLLSALEEVLLGDERFGETIGRFLFMIFFGALLLFAPVGISAGTFAYLSGLSSEVGRWMFFAGTAFAAVAFAIGFTIGRGSPSRRIL